MPGCEQIPPVGPGDLCVLGEGAVHAGACTWQLDRGQPAPGAGFAAGDPTCGARGTGRGAWGTGRLGACLWLDPQCKLTFESEKATVSTEVRPLGQALLEGEVAPAGWAEASRLGRAGQVTPPSFPKPGLDHGMSAQAPWTTSAWDPRFSG